MVAHRTETVVLSPAEHKAGPSAYELRQLAEVTSYVRCRGPATIALGYAELTSRPGAEVAAILKGEVEVPKDWK